MGSRYPFLTSKERDNETGLDYFGARYYSSTQGRFTSPDELSGDPVEVSELAEEANKNPVFYAELTQPQSLNKYQYCYNNPLRFVDPDGHQGEALWEELMGSPAGQWAASNADKVITAAGAATTTVIVAASGVGKELVKYASEHPSQSATQQDLEDLRGLRQDNTKENADSQPKKKSQDFTQADKQKIAARDRGNCQDCGMETERVQNKSGESTPKNQRQIHHKIPKKDRGTRDIDNGVTLCPTCHKERHRILRDKGQSDNTVPQ